MEHYPARYMLYVVPVRPAKHAALPAITHVDGTGRLQTVFEDAKSALSRPDQALLARPPGIPAVLNTSFNLKGEPIVTTPANAFSTFSAQRNGHAGVGQFLVEKIVR